LGDIYNDTLVLHYIFVGGFMARKKGSIKKTGTYKGKSNKLGHGGRAQQLKDKGVPGGVIGNLARKKGAAPGGPNYHPSKKGKTKSKPRKK
jgi:hypothetical protein